MSRNHLIRHPGPPAAERRRIVPGHARRVELVLPEGAVLMAAVAEAIEGLGCDSAVLVLDGLEIGPYDYVMPVTGSPDGRRAAWYSATHSGDRATLEHATATVGRRDGAWWLHCHAVWDSETGRQKAGHLLPDQITIARTARVTGFAFRGGRFEVTPCEETLFPLFRPVPTDAPEAAVNAAILTLGPFEDLAAATARAAGDLGLGASARLYGIGSLIGADFADAPAMESPVSEVVLLPGAAPGRLPAHCVDPEGRMFRGEILPGHAPVCITFEALIVAADPEEAPEPGRDANSPLASPRG